MRPLPGEGPGEPNPDRIRKNYEHSAANVRARFVLYELAQPYIDVEGHVIEALEAAGRLNGQSMVLDVGTADGSFPDRIRLSMRSTQNVSGVDFSPEQFVQFLDPRTLIFSGEDWLSVAKSKSRQARQLGSQIAGFMRAQAGGEVEPQLPTGELILSEGRAQSLDHQDNAFDVVSEMFMLYHLPYDERQRAYQEMRRVLKPDGIGVISTSGSRNKESHRYIESQIANMLGVEPPTYMNADFYSEWAVQELQQQFPYVYRFDQHSFIDITSPPEIDMYRRSLESMRDQFGPVPNQTRFDEAIEKAIFSYVYAEIGENGLFRDRVHRTVFFVSSNPLDIPDTYEFHLVT